MYSRLFAYNSSNTAPTGATQWGNIAVSNGSINVGDAGLEWFHGPDEDIKYIISHVSGPKTKANGAELITGTCVGWWKSTAYTDNSFISLAERIAAKYGQAQTFADGPSAKSWLNTNGFWTSYQGLVTSGLTLKLDAADSNSYSGSGTTWYDLVSPQQNITLVNSPTYTSGVPSYFTFNGSNQRGSGAGATGVLPQTSYTKSVWFYLNSYQDNNLVSSDTGGHFMYFNSTSTMYSGHANWPNYVAYGSSTTFSLNTWYYAALTFNTTDGMKLYVNGNFDSSYTANKTAHSGNGSINLAAFGSGNLLNGRIGKVYCYDRALTASEVLQNYNTDKAHFGY